MFHRQRRFTFECLESRQVLSAVSIPVDLTGEVGGEVAVPVEIADGDDVRAVELEINYDTELLDTDADSIVAGAAWGSDTVQVVVSVDDEAGTIVASVFGAAGLELDSGSILDITFTISSDAVVDDSTVIDLAEAVLNEGEITVDPEPQTGDDSTDGLVTFIATEQNDATISGTVYADVNQNDTCDDSEGIAGVKIVLTNEDTGEEQETYTDADGAYEFTDLAAGSYTISEQQPAAFVDGGTNDISVTLESSEALSGQDFQEGGLKPAYISNRLLTTLVLPEGSDAWNDAIEQIVEDAGSESDSEETSASQVPTEDGDSEETSADTAEVSLALAAETAQPSEQVAVAVEVEDAQGVEQVEIEISYDPALLGVETDDIQLGSLWSDSDAEIAVTIDTEAGLIQVTISASEALSSARGSLLDIDFTVNSDATSGDSAEIELAGITINDGEITANLDSDLATGLITVDD